MTTKHVSMISASTNPLPEGWRWVKLAELVSSLETGTRPKGGAVGVESGIPSISAEHMTPYGTFDFTTLRYVPEDFYEQMPRGHIQHGDILIVKDGATTGKICIVREDFPYEKAVINEHVFLCRPDTSKVVSEYLFYWLWGADGYGAIRSSFQGAAIGGINQGFVKTITLPLPPLSEQQRIVNILRDQMAAIKRARGAAEARLEAAKALPAAILSSIFSISKAQQWPLRNVGDITDQVIDGPHITPTYVNNGIPFVTVRNIVQRKLDFSELSYISEEDHLMFSKRGKAERGDILYSKDGTLGIPCLVDTDKEFSFFVSVALIKPLREIVHSRYLFYVLESADVLSQVERLGAGAGLKHMVLKSIRSLIVPLPEFSVQENIAKIIHDKLKAKELLQVAIEDELTAIKRMPAALLRQAFTGDL